MLSPSPLIYLFTNLMNLIIFQICYVAPDPLINNWINWIIFDFMVHPRPHTWIFLKTGIYRKMHTEPPSPGYIEPTVIKGSVFFPRDNFISARDKSLQI